MRDYTKVSSRVWRSQKFAETKGDERARNLYFYMLTNPEVNSAGCYDFSIAYALEYLGWTEAGLREAIAALLAVNLIAFDWTEKTVLIVNWVEHNPPTNARHAINMLNGLAQASSKRLRMTRGREIDSYVRERKYDTAHIGGAQLRQLLIAYRGETTDSPHVAYSTYTETKTVTGTETKTETETLTPTKPRKSSPPMAALPAGAPSALAGNDDDNIPDHLRTNLLMRRG